MLKELKIIGKINKISKIERVYCLAKFNRIHIRKYNLSIQKRIGFL